MSLSLLVLIGVLYAAGVFLVMERSLTRIALGEDRGVGGELLRRDVAGQLPEMGIGEAIEEGGGAQLLGDLGRSGHGGDGGGGSAGIETTEA